MFTNYARDQLLDAVLNGESTGLPSTDIYFQLHSGDPNATGASNVVSVARVQAPFGASSSGLASNTGNIDWASMPAVTGDGVWGWSAHDTAGSGLPPTGGNGLLWGPLATSEGYADVDSTDATNNDLQSVAHGLANNDRVCFLAVPQALGGSPGGLTLIGTGSGVLYHVISTGLTADSFRVSTTSGGGAVDITGDGTLRWFKVNNRTTNLNDTFRIATGDLDVYLEA